MWCIVRKPDYGTVMLPMCRLTKSTRGDTCAFLCPYPIRGGFSWRRTTISAKKKWVDCYRNLPFPSTQALTIFCLYNIVNQIFVGNDVRYLDNAASNVSEEARKNEIETSQCSNTVKSLFLAHNISKGNLTFVFPVDNVISNMFFWLNIQL